MACVVGREKENTLLMRGMVLAALCAGLLLGCMTGVQAQTSPRSDVPTQLQNVHKIVCLGDSITEQGEGPGGYVWLVRHYLAAIYPQQGIEVVNAGISGHKSSEMLARFQRDVLDRTPDLVTISVGVNDVWHAFRDFAHGQDYPEGNLPNGIPLEDYKKNVEAMIDQARKANIKVMILTPTLIYENLDSPENARLTRYCGALKDLAQRRKCLFVDYQKPFKDLVNVYRRETGGTDNLLTVDGVHMNSSGNKVMAHALLAGLGISSDARKAAQPTVEQELRDGKTP